MREALAAALALLPGLLTWAWGRRLVRSADDPTLPERLIVWRQRSALALATAAALLIVLLPRQAPWALPLLVLARLVGGFPARRALYREGWDLVAYLAHVVRVTLGLAGFWLLVMLAPALVASAGSAAGLVAGVLALVLVAWGLAHSTVLERLLAATPLAQPELVERFRAIAGRSRAPQPRLLVIGPSGGRWGNAFALPATGEPAVAFTRTLLETLDADELAAIFAHEQAHLEHHDAARVRRLAAAQVLAALVATLGAAAALGRLEGTGFAIGLGWALFVALALFVRAVRHRAHEAASDRRAVELCGDARALVRGLVKLHALALLPRRLDVEQERWATHPSLANRLRALEALASPAEPASGGTTTDAPSTASASASSFPATALAGAASGSWVVLEAQHAHWLEGVPAGTPREAEVLRAAAPRVRSLAYSELVELRLRPRGRDGHALAATDRDGAAWSLPLAAGEGAAAHAALDAVDGRLAPHSAARPEYRSLGALVACAGALLAALLASGATLPAIVAVVLAHPGPLAAFGVAAVVAALQLLGASATPALWIAPRLAPLASLGLALLGVAALWLARATAWREQAGRTRSAPWVGLGLALAGVLTLLPTGLALVGGGALRAHLVARDHPSGALLVLAAAAAFAVVPRSWGRAAAAALAIVASLPLALGTQAFARRFVQDPFFAPGANASASSTVTARLLDEQPLPALSGELLLSPSGRSWGIRRFDLSRDDSPPRSRLVVGSAAGARFEYGASDLVLLDDSLLLALLADANGLAVERRPHDPAAPPLWRVPLPPLSEGPRLAADPATGRWRVVGLDEDTGSLLRVTGGADGAFSVARWDPGTQAAAWVVGAGPAALGIAPDLDAAPGALLEADVEEDTSGVWWWWLRSPGVTGFGSRVLALDAHGAHPLYASRLFVQCDEPRPDAVELLCRAHDGSRTSLWHVDPATGERQRLAVLDGLAWSTPALGDGWLVLVNAGRQQELFRLRGERLERLDLGGTPPWIHAVAGFEAGVAAVVSDTRGPRLRRFALP